MKIALPKPGGRGRYRPSPGACDEPMTLPELAAIWRALPEERRFAFVLALEEDISYRLIEYTAQQSASEDQAK